MATHEKDEKPKANLSYLQRVLDVTELYQQHKHPGVVDVWIYRTYIRPRFHISYATFLRYLSRPAAKEMREALADLEGKSD